MERIAEVMGAELITAEDELFAAFEAATALLPGVELERVLREAAEVLLREIARHAPRPRSRCVC